MMLSGIGFTLARSTTFLDNLSKQITNRIGTETGACVTPILTEDATI